MFTKDYYDSLHETAEMKDHFVDVFSLRMPKLKVAEFPKLA